jgi:hypothetical protein
MAACILAQAHAVGWQLLGTCKEASRKWLFAGASAAAAKADE